MKVFKFYTTNKYYGGEYSVVLTPRCPFYQFFFIFVFPLQSFHVYYRESTITGNINLAILQDVQYLKDRRYLLSFHIENGAFVQLFLLQNISGIFFLLDYIV